MVDMPMVYHTCPLVVTFPVLFIINHYFLYHAIAWCLLKQNMVCVITMTNRNLELLLRVVPTHTEHSLYSTTQSEQCLHDTMFN